MPGTTESVVQIRSNLQERLRKQKLQLEMCQVLLWCWKPIVAFHTNHLMTSHDYVCCLFWIQLLTSIMWRTNGFLLETNFLKTNSDVFHTLSTNSDVFHTLSCFAKNAMFQFLGVNAAVSCCFLLATWAGSDDMRPCGSLLLVRSCSALRFTMPYNFFLQVSWYFRHETCSNMFGTSRSWYETYSIT